MLGAGLHGPGPREPDREQRPGDGACRRSSRAASSRRVGAFEYAGRADAVIGERPSGTRGRDTRRGSAVVDRGCPSPLCARSSSTSIVDVTGSVELGGPRCARGIRAWQARRRDERGGRRDRRPDPPDVRAPSTASCSPPATATSPGLQMNLYRWVKGLGLIPRVLGNVKGLQDPVPEPGDAAGVRRDSGDRTRRW